MEDKLQEIVNEASIRTTIFEDTYIVEIRKESFDYLIEQAEKTVNVENERYYKALIDITTNPSIHSADQMYKVALKALAGDPE
ncbi:MULTISPECIES: hypothetical protein [Bacillus]|uniref:Uncharacterized protein n=2 Tax=Bacillus TaxID=1386 RepID=A0A0M4FGP9_9BACI|nr:MULTISPECIES: hypothetical protein [Bacillus]ALC81749.1 hypothetical protein AM592_09110 [Bacillus gobiensis]MBP1080829.1 phosphopantothenate synthetase [Bacillus capparidis]MED1097473.1 hypothetical protein [Bacillus capparidis]